jgi:hypothetical protein
LLLRFDAYSGGSFGAKFSDIAPEVILIDIIEEAANTNLQTAAFAGGHGQIVYGNTRDSLAVRLVYVIRTQDPARRAAVQGLIQAWAKKVKKLAISTRPNVALRGQFYNLSAQMSALQWTQEMQLVFTAYDVPFWQDERTSVSKFLSRGENTEISCICTADRVPVTALITNDGTDTLTEVILNVGHTKLHLQGLQLDPTPDSSDGIVQEESLEIKSETGHDFTIRTLAVGGSGGESFLHTRTPDSSDVLLVDTNEETPVYFWADQPSTCWLMCYRWWL